MHASAGDTADVASFYGGKATKLVNETCLHASDTNGRLYDDTTYIPLATLLAVKNVIIEIIIRY